VSSHGGSLRDEYGFLTEPGITAAGGEGNRILKDEGERMKDESGGGIPDSSFILSNDSFDYIPRGEE
jgi:hypothetical protein